MNAIPSLAILLIVCVFWNFSIIFFSLYMLNTEIFNAYLGFEEITVVFFSINNMVLIHSLGFTVLFFSINNLVLIHSAGSPIEIHHTMHSRFEAASKVTAVIQGTQGLPHRNLMLIV